MTTIDAEMGTGWQPIETAPKDGGVSVLLYVRNSKHWKGEEPATMCVGYWADFNGGRWVHGSIGEPTHWMALPPPPGDAQESHL